MKFHVGRDLINAGRAEQYFFGEPAKVTPFQPTAAPIAPPTSTGKKKKK